MNNHSPVRKCIGCGKRKSKFELIRIVNNNEQIFIDPDANIPGRGAYICASINCINNAKEKNKFSKALKTKKEDKIYSLLMEEIGNDIND